MRSHPFFQDATKSAVTEAVKHVEAQTSAELVVAVRAQADLYRDIDFLVGAAVALLTITLLIFLPTELDENLMPIETLVGFLAGSLLVSKVAPLKRLLLSRKRVTWRIEEAARAQFVSAGIDHTTRRMGILVFVSLFEKRVHLVADHGVDLKELGAGFQATFAKMEAAVTAADVPGFIAALRELATPLAEKHPHHEGDLNELPDSPDVGAAS